MKLRDYFKVGLASLLLAGILCFTASKYDLRKQFQGRNQKPKIVQIGNAEYNRGDLISYGFVRCSAVIFDYGNSAFMAHTLPLLELDFVAGEKYSITARGVVEYLVQESERKGFNPNKAKVYVNAGDKESLDKIIESLRAKNIPLTEGNLRFEDGYVAQPKDSVMIQYNPLRNEINIFKEK